MAGAPIHFLILCIETYKVLHNMPGEEVLDLFDRSGVTDFIIKFHDILHIESPRSVVAQIDEFMAHGEPLMAAGNLQRPGAEPES